MTTYTPGIGNESHTPFYKRYPQGVDPNMPWYYYEFYTPEHIIEAVIDVLGEIDLDPCSNSYTNPNIPAKYLYTKVDNALQYTWYDKVYMNPPYGYAITEWIEKLRCDYEVGHVTEAIMLVPASVGTRWFARMEQYPHCFLDDKLHFLRPLGFTVREARGATAIFYLGQNVGRFAEVFSQFGRLMGCAEEAALIGVSG